MRAISHSYPKPGKEQIYVQPKMQGIPAMWVDVEDHQFDPPSSKLIMELLHKPKNGLMPDEATVALEEAKLARVLDVYEERLIHSKYLGGDKFTAADLTHLPNIHYLLQTPTKRLFNRRPHVGAWCAAITSRPVWKQVIKMVDAANKK
ncbi:glutathione transferase [Sarracenia purpurea var. burkii]